MYPRFGKEQKTTGPTPSANTAADPVTITGCLLWEGEVREGATLGSRR